MLRLTILLLLLAGYFRLTAQESHDTISIKELMWSKFFEYRGKSIGHEGLYFLTIENQAANAEIQKAINRDQITGIMSSAVFGLIIWGISGKTPDDTRQAIAGALVGIAIASIPISISSNRHAKKGVLLYNQLKY